MTTKPYALLIEGKSWSQPYIEVCNTMEGAKSRLLAYVREDLDDIDATVDEYFEKKPDMSAQIVEVDKVWI